VCGFDVRVGLFVVVCVANWLWCALVVVVVVFVACVDWVSAG